MTEPVTLTLPAWAVIAVLVALGITSVLSAVQSVLVWKTHKIKQRIAALEGDKQ